MLECKKNLQVIWVIGIIFPVAWLGYFPPFFHEVFSEIFSPEWLHWVMHAILYAGLAALVMFNLHTQPGWKTFWRVILVTLSVGFLQEGFQLLSGVETLKLNILLDLGIDCAGTLFGYGLFTRIAWPLIDRSHSLRHTAHPGTGDLLPGPPGNLPPPC
jgi:hypothetical protein